MITREEILTEEKINDLEIDFQDGLCEVKCLESHFTEFFIPILEDFQTQGRLYPNLTNMSATMNPICPVLSKELGEITKFERYESDKAKIKVEWNNGIKCDYLLHPGKKLPFQLNYKPEENPAQQKIEF